MILSVLRKLSKLLRLKLFSTKSIIVKRELILILSLLFISEIKPLSSQVVPRGRVITITKLIYLLYHKLRPLRF
jgi:hypothetical protein